IVLQTQETTMFTKTFTIEHHIEELRAELRVMTDAEERREIQAELAAMMQLADYLDRVSEAML
ncbi:MAG TPA: hypothetical protein PK080_11165, partial [Hyphomonadaceae bacterium]|nr:hypothetical protein [Hyphomonadaceae bacterium]